MSDKNTDNNSGGSSRSPTPFTETAARWKSINNNLETALIKGDTGAALEILYREGRDLVWGLISYYGHGRLSNAEKEDVLQEAMVSSWLWFSKPAIDTSEPMRMVNHCTRQAVGNAFRSLGRANLSSLQHDPAVKSSSQSNLEAVELMSEILTLVTKLPPQQRKVIEAFIHNQETDQHPHSVLAGFLEMSENTFNHYLSIVRSKFIEWLNGLELDFGT